jgi:hypothetical protein
MSWINWYFDSSSAYEEGSWAQESSRVLRLQRIKEEKQIIEETLGRRSMTTTEQAELIPPDIDEILEFGIQDKSLLASSIEFSEQLYGKTKTHKQAKSKSGRPQNTTRVPVPKKIKRLLVETRGGICEWCKEEVFQQIHHIDGNPANNNLTNLMLICYECHKQIERDNNNGS